MLQRLARFCYRRRWRVLGAWVVLLAGLFVLNSSFGGKFLDDFDLPGSESQEAVDLLEEHGFDTRAGATGQVVFQADDVNDPTVRRDMEALFDEIAEITAPSEVVSP
jgi:RND superfamily putative drug exporter